MEKDQIKLFEEVIKNLSDLNLILYKLLPNLSLESDSELIKMSENNDMEIKNLTDRIKSNLEIISKVLRRETQVTPYNKEDTDKVIIKIMAEYMNTSMIIKVNSFIVENYSVELSRIHSAFCEFYASINDYNGFAKNKNWPEIITENEAFIIVSQLFQSVTL